LDEGDSTYVIYLPCWRALGSPKLTSSPTTLKEFDGRDFQPHELLQYFTVTLKGKIVSFNIEVFDAPMNYNLLVGHSWLCVMIVIASTMFRVLQFPHQGKIIIVDQLDYINPDLHNVATNDIHFLGQSSLESVGLGLLKDSSLVGFFLCLLLPSTGLCF
jgi:hypothetical protein